MTGLVRRRFNCREQITCSPTWSSQMTCSLQNHWQDVGRCSTRWPEKWQLFHWEDSWAIRMHPATVTIHTASERSTSQHSVTERLISDYTIYRILHKAILKESLLSKHPFIYDQFARLYKMKSNNKSQNQFEDEILQ